MNSLKQAVQTYAKHHANHDGLVITPLPGLSMMRVETPAGDLQSIYKPLVCLVLQGAKRMAVEHQSRVVAAEVGDCERGYAGRRADCPSQPE